MAGLPPFISFSTSYPKLNSAVLRHTDNERFVGNPSLYRIMEGLLVIRQLEQTGA